MRKTPRFVFVTFPAILLAATLWLRSGSAPPPDQPHPTIEPTLPLLLELRAVPADPRSGGPPHLEASLESTGELQDVTLSLVLPPDLGGDPGELRPGRPIGLRAGEKRRYSVPIEARRAGAFPIRLEAAFRLPDGTLLHTQQGILWSNGPPAREGRHHAGAYEWMGVPVQEPQP